MNAYKLAPNAIPDTHIVVVHVKDGDQVRQVGPFSAFEPQIVSGFLHVMSSNGTASIFNVPEVVFYIAQLKPKAEA